MADAPAPPSKPKKAEWAPRMWEGCNSWAWFRLLWKGRFRVHWTCWHIVVIAMFMTTLHTVLRFVQWLIYGRAIRRTELVGPPIFILGHWRTGTTLMHELMIQDERFGYPTTYECMDPNHFLLTEGLFTKWLKFLVPARRPMDNMKAGFDRPQEDEFALCMLGLPSPYLTIAFPNRGPQDQEYLDLEGVRPRALARWKRGLMWLLQTITYKQKKRLVLKSPPHTARLKVLREMFPDAIYVHIMRDPYVVWSSTVNLWRRLYQSQGLQKPTCEGLEEHVFETYLRVYRRLEEGRQGLGDNQYFEIRYEDLVKDPAGTMRSIYERFGLGGWEAYRPRLEAYLESVKGYETNQFRLTREQRDAITARWGDIARRYGYSPPPLPDDPPAA